MTIDNCNCSRGGSGNGDYADEASVEQIKPCRHHCHDCSAVFFLLLSCCRINPLCYGVMVDTLLGSQSYSQCLFCCLHDHLLQRCLSGVTKTPAFPSSSSAIALRVCWRASLFPSVVMFVLFSDCLCCQQQLRCSLAFLPSACVCSFQSVAARVLVSYSSYKAPWARSGL